MLIDHSMRKKKLQALPAHRANAIVLAWCHGLLILFSGRLSSMLPAPLRTRLPWLGWPKPEGAWA